MNFRHQPRLNNSRRGSNGTSACQLTSASYRRKQSGSILPLVAFMLAIVIAFIALTADVMRTVYAGIKLQTAVESSALAAYSYAVDHSGSFSQNNIVNKLNEISGSSGIAWNKAPAGPENNVFETPVTFDSSDYQFNPNPNDNNESFFQLTARRNGLDAIKLFFVPAIFFWNSQAGLPGPPDSAKLANTYRVTEVISQPASRIGEAPPASTPNFGRNGDLKGFGTFPIAISNAQFLAASSSSSSIPNYTIDLVSNIKPAPATLPGHLKGCFVNLRSTGSTLAAYGEGQGNNAVDELIHLLEYFQVTPPAGAYNPYVVERGSFLSAFDHEEVSFKNREQEIKAKLSTIPTGRFQIIPVLRNDPVIGGAANEVVGFARFRITNVVNPTDGSFRIQMQIGPSAPIRNASSANTIATIPTINGSLLPPPVAPFGARNTGITGQEIGVLPRGVVMAPSLSPRILAGVKP